MIMDAVNIKEQQIRKNTENGEGYKGNSEDCNMKNDFSYQWKNDLKGILDFCEAYKTGENCETSEIAENSEMSNNSENCAKIAKQCNLFELGHLLGMTDMEFDATYISGYLSEIEKYKSSYEDSRITENEFKEIEKWLRGTEDYQTYLYFLNDFKVVHHFAKKPNPARSRKLPVLMVDEYDDGEYVVRGELTVKYPEFHYIVNKMLEQRQENRKTFGLVVDREEVLTKASDIDCALCGFQVTYASLEIFDKVEAIKRFGIALRAAQKSGKCKVSKGFY
jgi:hypothetical protein